MLSGHEYDHPRVLAVREGTKYGSEYTRALKNQCDAYILGDDRPLRTDFRGWQAKIELFAPWNADLRPCWYVDLDTYVIARRVFAKSCPEPEKLWLINAFYVPEKGETGVMWIPEDTTEIWERREEMTADDATYLRKFPHRRLNDVVSGIYSYKLHCREKLPEDATIVCFHGTPKPHETDGWAKFYWMTKLRRS